MKNTIVRHLLACTLTIACIAPAATAMAEDGEVVSPLSKGGYLAPMATYVISDKDSELDDGYGAVLMLGHRSGWYAMEVGGVYHDLDKTSVSGFALNGLIFPLKSLSGLYVTIGTGAQEYKKYPGLLEKKRPHAIQGNAGVGYILPLKVGNYDFGVRSEFRYRISKRDKRQNDTDIDLDMPRRFDDMLVNIGLQLPLSKAAPPPPPPPEAAVVAPQPPADADGDGVPDDIDQCPGTPAGTKVDEKGCPAKPPCELPAAGEKITLEGCKTGDVVVLRGVNFEFDKSKLTVNATTILDGVADALKAHPSITVLIAGHTDSLGSDEYNQRLSMQRAKSVRAYLVKVGIDASRVAVVGHGETQPVSTNETEEGRELNRRVELQIQSASEESAASVTVENAPSQDATAAGVSTDAAATPQPIEAAPPAAGGDALAPVDAAGGFQ